MAKLLFSLLFLLTWCEATSAQQLGRYVYGVAAPVIVPQSGFTRWNGEFMYIGGGVEFRPGDRLGLGGDAGVLTPLNNQFAITAGLAAFAPSFHFISRNSNSRVDPFVSGGIAELFNSGSVSVPAIHFGGGVNYTVRPRLALRFEFRHHVWTPQSGYTVNLSAIRIGIGFGF